MNATNVKWRRSHTSVRRTEVRHGSQSSMGDIARALETIGWNQAWDRYRFVLHIEDLIRSFGQLACRRARNVATSAPSSVFRLAGRTLRCIVVPVWYASLGAAWDVTLVLVYPSSDVYGA